MAYLVLDPKKVQDFIGEQVHQWKTYARDSRGEDRVVLDYNYVGYFRVYRMTEHQATHHDGETVLYYGNNLEEAVLHFNQGI